MTQLILNLLHFWESGGAAVLMGLGILGIIWCLLRWYRVEREDPLDLLQDRFDGLTRWLLLHRRSPKTLPISLGFLALGVGIYLKAPQEAFWRWALHNGQLFLGAHLALLLLVLAVWMTWNREPKYTKAGEGRADAQFRDVAEEWGTTLIEEGKVHRDDSPTAELLVFRSPEKIARRLFQVGQRFKGFLTLLSLRWDIFCRHILVLGSQGSGKTATIYGPIMHSSLVPWVYQDAKAELPFWEEFSILPVFGLDVRGHKSRSGIWNPMEEIRSTEDFDLLVDYTFPKNPKDPNGWVRDMARVIFSAILRSKRWESIQQIARTLRETRLEPFLTTLDPIYQDAMKEPKSQVPVLQDLVVTLSRWETERVRAITEGMSTVNLEEYIELGGYVMNCEDSDSLKVPVHVFLAMLLGRLRNRPEGASPLLLLLDEFGDCGRIPNVQRALVLLRSKGVSIVAGIQNLGLLQDVYPQDWRAVLEGFGTKIWLARNLEEDLRQRLSVALGKFTRRVPPSNKNAKETEKESDLMPLDAWGAWSEARVALGRLHGFTYWLPVPIPIPKTPLGPALVGGDPWADSEAELQAAAQDALRAAELPDWCLQVPEMPLNSTPSDEALNGEAAPMEAITEEDWI